MVRKTELKSRSYLILAALYWFN